MEVVVPISTTKRPSALEEDVLERITSKVEWMPSTLSCLGIIWIVSVVESGSQF